MNEFNLTTNCGKLPFNLSERIIKEGKIFYVLEDDLKEFIKRLKEWSNRTPKHQREEDCPHCKTLNDFDEIIDKLAGKDLVKKNGGKDEK